MPIVSNPNSIVKSKDDLPETLKPYLFHGLVFSKIDSKHATGDCPFCSKEGKFVVEIGEGLWRCLHCNEGSAASGKVNQGGNIYTFMNKLLVYSAEQHVGNEDDYDSLLTSRRLLRNLTLQRWGIVRSLLLPEVWLVPAWNIEGKLNQIYQYRVAQGKRKATLYATIGLNHGLFGRNLYKPDCSTIYLCEGPWDGVILWETMSSAKKTEGNELELTTSEEMSLLANSCVLSTPGANVFRDDWCSLFSGKRVCLMYDNDHPKELKEKTIDGTGLLGMKRIAQILAKYVSPPESIFYLDWNK